jgi:hypothetical protein
MDRSGLQYHSSKVSGEIVVQPATRLIQEGSHRHSVTVMSRRCRAASFSCYEKSARIFVYA